MWAWMQPLCLVDVAPRPPSMIVAVGLSAESIERIRASSDSVRARARLEGCNPSTVARIRTGAMHLVPRPRRWVRVSDDTVEEIRVRHEESGWTCTQLAKFYGLPKSTVNELLKYRRR